MWIFCVHSRLWPVIINKHQSTREKTTKFIWVNRQSDQISVSQFMISRLIFIFFLRFHSAFSLQSVVNIIATDRSYSGQCNLFSIHRLPALMRKTHITNANWFSVGSLATKASSTAKQGKSYQIKSFSKFSSTLRWIHFLAPHTNRLFKIIIYWCDVIFKGNFSTVGCHLMMMHKRHFLWHLSVPTSLCRSPVFRVSNKPGRIDK